MYNSMYPVNMKPYPIGQSSQPVKQKEENESSSSSDIQKDARDARYRDLKEQRYPNGEKTSIDYMSTSKINISQVVDDFKKTTAAIAAPAEVQAEVEAYLSLIESQAGKESPNKEVIKANLVSASKILDEYIAKTLNRKSNVVENWIDALFLQKIDYKADKSANNPDFRVQLPEKAPEAEVAAVDEFVQEPAPQAVLEANAPLQIVQKNDSSLQIDPQLKKMFLQAKKFAAINQDEKAFSAFKKALNYATDIKDTGTQSLIHYEVAKIYDNYDNLVPALRNYNQAAQKTTDNNVKARAHISMARIYDDVVQFEPAMEHYYAAISFAGESENLNAQTKALTNIGKMYSERYDKANTEDYFSLATEIVRETKNEKSIGFVYSAYGDALSEVNEKTKALKMYSEGAKHYTQAEAGSNAAKNYEKASELMLGLGNRAKAKSLLLKAQKHYMDINDNTALQNINEKLKNI